ncbi:carbohydrate-binding protein [Streptomyces sp. NPDC059373]
MPWRTQPSRSDRTDSARRSASICGVGCRRRLRPISGSAGSPGIVVTAVPADDLAGVARSDPVVPNALSFRDSSGTTLATVSVPDTGGWGSYQSVHVPVSLSEGDQVVTLYCETGGFNIDYLLLSQ